MPILQEAEEKLRLGQPKTQLFDKSCVLGPGKKCVQNVHTVTVGLMMNYENTHNNSSLTPEASHPSSDLSTLPLHEAPLTPPISSIIKIQTQKHNLKINQTTTIKAKKFSLS